jgi:hypothetical protein
MHLDAGQYRLTARAPGHEASHTELSIKSGQRRRIQLTLARSLARREPSTAVVAGDVPRDDSGTVLEQWWFWSAVGLAVAGSVVTTLLISEEETPTPDKGDLGRSVGVLRFER